MRRYRKIYTGAALVVVGIIELTAIVGHEIPYWLGLFVAVVYVLLLAGYLRDLSAGRSKK
jgi:hypothetical protein